MGTKKLDHYTIFPGSSPQTRPVSPNTPVTMTRPETTPGPVTVAVPQKPVTPAQQQTEPSQPPTPPSEQTSPAADDNESEEETPPATGSLQWLFLVSLLSLLRPRPGVGKNPLQ